MTTPGSVTYTGARTADGSPVIRKQVDDRPPVPLPVHHDLARHADAGNWGYFGSGPRQLAVMLLADVLGDEAATALSQRFKAEVVVGALHALGRGQVWVGMSVQPDGVARVRAAFARVQSEAGRWAFITVRPPGERAVAWLLGRFPGLSTAALRPEFRSLLGNLKVFDWVARLQSDGGLADPTGVVTLTALIDRLWAHFVEGDTHGLARAGLLKRLAAAEADHLALGTPLSELGPDELVLLPRLEAADLVRRHAERVRFALKADDPAEYERRIRDYHDRYCRSWER